MRQGWCIGLRLPVQLRANNQNDYISTYEIATLIGISRRSVREEINNVKNILKELEIHFTSKPNKGYIIDEKTPEIINKL